MKPTESLKSLNSTNNLPVSLITSRKCRADVIFAKVLILIFLTIFWKIQYVLLCIIHNIKMIFMKTENDSVCEVSNYFSFINNLSLNLKSHALNGRKYYLSFYLLPLGNLQKWHHKSPLIIKVFACRSFKRTLNSLLFHV